MAGLKHYLIRPLVTDNPVTVQMLGICSALAVTTNLSTAVTMSIAVFGVMVIASGTISLIRKHIPDSIRLILQITIIASLVIVTDQILQAWFFETSQILSIFVGLIVTNCLVMGRAEGFAMHNDFIPSVLDAIGNALGYGLLLLTVAAIREFFGLGTLFGYEVVVTQSNEGWFAPVSMMQKAPSAFFIIGLLIWLIKSVQKATPHTPEISSGTRATKIIPVEPRTHD